MTKESKAANGIDAPDAYERALFGFDRYRAAVEANLGVRYDRHAKIYEAAKGELMKLILEMTGQDEFDYQPKPFVENAGGEDPDKERTLDVLPADQAVVETKASSKPKTTKSN